jgi:hypothetical protein
MWGLLIMGWCADMATGEAGRPTKLTDEARAFARSYVEGGWEACGHAIPSIVGLAKELKCSDATMYLWADKDEEMSGIMRRIVSDQHFVLLNRGLTKQISEPICKLVLGKHGYHDMSRSELVGDGGGAIKTATRIEIVPMVANSDSGSAG